MADTPRSSWRISLTAPAGQRAAARATVPRPGPPPLLFQRSWLCLSRVGERQPAEVGLPATGGNWWPERSRGGVGPQGEGRDAAGAPGVEVGDIKRPVRACQQDGLRAVAAGGHRRADRGGGAARGV